ncbi:ABC transporter ATP-binding protein [Methylocella sp.]|uniref:ABC transporter ATP-binding protein n=1 Tax=Methylocella sp. TaxID=1978226 RepID=UPI003784D0F6
MTRSDAAHLVELRGVAKAYGARVALRDVSFTLEPGAIALVGHNGAGKTTLMKLMLGLVRPTAGTVRVLGDNPTAGEFAGRRRLGYLPESIAFSGALTGRETLAFYARLKGCPDKRCAPLLERVGLADAANLRVGTYSKGMRQRLGLAQALIGEPDILLLDEPTTGLDPALRRTFYEIVRECAARGAVALLSSHALDELEDQVGRVIILDRGLKKAEGSLDALRGLARLPTRVRARVNGALPALPEDLGPPRACGPGLFELKIPEARKIETLRALLDGQGGLLDVEVIPPSLDELYAHFLSQREAAP